MNERSIEGTEPGYRFPDDDVDGHMPRIYVDLEKTDDEAAADVAGHCHDAGGYWAAGVPD